MNRLRWASGLVSLLLSVSSCVATVDEPNDCSEDDCQPTESVGSSVQPLVGGWATGPYTWSQGERARKLDSVAASVCVLTRLTGKFEGGGEAVQVTNDGTDWYLSGFSQQRDVGGEAYCFARDKFRGRDDNTRVSSEYALPSYFRRLNHDCPAGVNKKEMYAADAFGFLNGLRGGLNGGAEYGLVQQARSSNELSFLESHSCVEGQDLVSFAYNLRIGTRTSRLAKFVNSQSELGDINDIADFAAGGGWTNPQNFVIMARTSEAMCAFTRLQGEFAGSGEYAQIRAELVAGIERWVLRTHKGADSHYVRADARCFARDQRL
jgi:hypothetical protein